MNELVMVKRNKVVCGSLEVAKKFQKKHKNVIQAIEVKILPFAKLKFTRLNFQPSEYIDESGKANKMYLMTRDGFSLLAMGFTGKQAMEWKIKYINAFNQMEKLLLEHQTPQYIEARQQGKLIRRKETDAIKQFIEYAASQGSTHAMRYYTNLSLLADKAIGIDDRDMMTTIQAHNLRLIETIISKCIAMRANKPYKDIYQNCKAMISSFIVYIEE